ncbi:MAG TPA: hypothetical protein VGN17_19475 [Bryobacteraceae bacterium]|jgi:hypothetical protein
MTLQKLTPNHDLQCFFFHPSAIAALSSTSDAGFTVSGTWRQQFDWAVIEWNRDNVYEHPALRNLPDGDLSGLTLSYQESRTNCIPMDSDLFRINSWPYLRVWAPDASGVEQVYQVPLKGLATPIAGSYATAFADFTLSGTITAGDFVGIGYLGNQVTYPVGGWEGTIPNLLDQIVAAFATQPLLRATRTGSTLRVYYTGGAELADPPTTGANGNRVAVYSFAASATGGASTLSWDSDGQTLTGGTSPTTWQVTIPFNSLSGYIDPDYSTLHSIVHPEQIRKLRWTYAADLQAGAYTRSDFEAVISNWTVTGTGRDYAVAGAGTRRIEDHSVEAVYSGGWSLTTGMSKGNYSGGTIHLTKTPGDAVSCTYSSPSSHTLYLGSRRTSNATSVGITVDGAAVAGTPFALTVAGEDVLVRLGVGTFAAGTHTITATHAGASGEEFWFDFVEAAVPAAALPTFPDEPRLTLATDWDTDHSLALAPERTAWMMDTLGFKGRANHYIGALRFYELFCDGNSYAIGTVTFTGGPDSDPSVTNSVTLTVAGLALTKLIHMGDTADTLAQAFADELNRGYISFRGSASGNVLTIYARMLGTEGNAVTVSASTSDATLWQATASGSSLTGGVDGKWRTDLSAMPRLNRAARDWTASYFSALHSYGIDGAAAFSMEIGDGDPSVAAGIAQRGPVSSLPENDAILLPTPSLQMNFSPTSVDFWKEAYLELAAIQTAAGLQPFLQFGEVQWWYFTTNGMPSSDPAFVDYQGMPFYDAWTQAGFLAAYGRAMTVFTTDTVNPATYPDEMTYLSGVLGSFTNSVISFVRSTYSTCRFEVLWPGDVNAQPFNRAFNFPGAWAPSSLDVLKTECFGFTLGRNLDSSEETILDAHGFSAAQRAHLVGVGDSTTAWLKEVRSALGKGFESVVLFALDQYSLIGYETPLRAGLRRSVRMGS